MKMKKKILGSVLFWSCLVSCFSFILLSTDLLDIQQVVSVRVLVLLESCPKPTPKRSRVGERLLVLGIRRNEVQKRHIGRCGESIRVACACHRSVCRMGL